MYLVASLVVGVSALKPCPNKNKNKIMNSLSISMEEQKAAELRMRAQANTDSYFRFGDHGFVLPLTDEKQKLAEANQEERRRKWTEQIEAEAKILKQQEPLQELPELQKSKESQDNPANTNNDSDLNTDRTSDCTSIDLDQSGINLEPVSVCIRIWGPAKCQPVSEPFHTSEDKATGSAQRNSDINPQPLPFGLVESDYFKNMDFDRLEINNALERTYEDAREQLRKEAEEKGGKYKRFSQYHDAMYKKVQARGKHLRK